MVEGGRRKLERKASRQGVKKRIRPKTNLITNTDTCTQIPTVSLVGVFEC